MFNRKMISKLSLKVLPLIFGIDITFLSYSIASVRNDPPKDIALLLPNTALNKTRYASISTQLRPNENDFNVNPKSLSPEIKKDSEIHSYSDTENKQLVGQSGKYKRDAESRPTQKSMAGYNFLSNLYHRLTEITRNHNKMYNIRYKSGNVSQHHENIVANTTTATSSPSEIHTSHMHTTSSTTTRSNSTEFSTTSGQRLLTGRSKNLDPRNHKTEHPTPRSASPGQKNNLSMNGTKDKSQKPCPKCRTNTLVEDEVVALRTAQFKDLLLDKLRLSKEDLSVKPSHGYPKLPRDILEKTLRDNAREEAMEEFYARDKELILDGRDLGRKCIKSRQVTGCFIFVLEGKVRGEVASAQLWLYKTPDGNDVSGQTVRVFQLEKTRRGRLRRRNLMIRQDTYVQEGWITMNVTRSVRSWVDKRMQTAMMAIRCDTCRTRNHKALYGAKVCKRKWQMKFNGSKCHIMTFTCKKYSINSDYYLYNQILEHVNSAKSLDWSFQVGYRPLLIIDYDTSVLSPRKRRTVEDCDPSFECCKRNLELSFTNIGMPTILVPTSISIGYCFGYCNDSPQYLFNHTQLIQAARLNDPTLNATMRRQIQPCCIPLTFQDTSFLIYTNQGIIQTTVPNVRVKSCGCV